MQHSSRPALGAGLLRSAKTACTIPTSRMPPQCPVPIRFARRKRLAERADAQSRPARTDTIRPAAPFIRPERAGRGANRRQRFGDAGGFPPHHAVHGSSPSLRPPLPKPPLTPQRKIRSARNRSLRPDSRRTDDAEYGDRRGDGPRTKRAPASKPANAVFECSVKIQIPHVRPPHLINFSIIFFGLFNFIILNLYLITNRNKFL